MPAQARVGDIAKCDADSHGCPACPHPPAGPLVGGSPDVFVNGLPAGRKGDPGIHAACCGPNTWQANMGSATVLINGKAAYRKGDMSKHCGGVGSQKAGSADVITGG
ncbi:MAG: PAAR domain-containing protein [Myxococcota bacterium]